MRKFIAAVIIAAVFAISASAQETAEQTAIRKALAELEGRRAEVAALKETIGAKDKQIAALNALLDNQAAIIEQWKIAATERGTANTIDARIEASYKASIASYSVELAAVRIERDKARAAKKWWGLAGLAFGIAVGVLVAGGND